MKTIIGFEIHEQLATETKLYCDSPTDYRKAPPNTNVCEVCTGMPGSKPHRVNQDAIDAAVEIALMLGCEIVKDPIYIQRKHYDYPDLPSGYQRTSLPIGKNGSLAGVGIWEVHLEEDPGKYDPQTGKVDYNRSGVPLVEIVTAPDIKSPEEARRFLRELVKVLQYTGKVRTEGGTMRTDTNISLEGGARVEIKNINSVKGAYKALKFEITRQKNLMKRGHAVKRETRAFVEAQMITRGMRTKEEAEDYRYIPDPDIPPIVITEEKIREIKEKMPETPQMKERRFIEQYGVAPQEAFTLASELELANAFEEVAKHVDPRLAARWMVRDLIRVLEYNSLSFRESTITTGQLIELLQMVAGHEITVKTGQRVIEMLVERPHSPREIVEELGLGKIKEEDVVEKAVEEAIAENEKAVKDYLSGKEEALNYVVGQVMKKTRGRADPATVLKMLKEKIGKG
ncbi:MAG: Asp-tRNA(Asn)/Glu-tRNA(Gln) amidotransferase subunit GatB [Methanobacteriota archaeon]|nr:MAG: Asp-tRNA(Asn)/Glu-tRNA(Gln) amidotransferase subunit GatB [Euryarchaeota archaeon]